MSTVALRDELGVKAVVWTPVECAALGRLVSRLVEDHYRRDGQRVPAAVAAILREMVTAGDEFRRRNQADQPIGTNGTGRTGDPPTLTTAEAAARLGTSERYVRRLAQTGELPATRVAGAWTIDPAALAELEAARRTRPT